MTETAHTHITRTTRADGRTTDEIRPVTIQRNWTDAPEGSVLIQCGNTRVLCTATFTEGVPRWRRDSGLGWVTAEYSMLPRATAERTDRESIRGKVGGRTHEISRLIGRVLRGVVDMKALGENQIQIDCDVLQADGGTRTASITGAYVALADAIEWARQKGHVAKDARVLTDQVSAISVGIIHGTPMLDLPYVEDSHAQTDMNVAMTGSGRFIEVQGTAEGAPYSRDELGILLDLAEKGNRELQALQREALAA
ncbi:ribonuclease PH [Alloscardovia macacae]|uniref:Ribonuclease PH n=1 Tax=Alloscardovia macacae TaxID=1160091 RepID=A0A1Y2T014_9BIFI|nr:ribonuclease PH [Alloscardovia macacae]OTA26595.1 ribonuclease PH [Alloscardovia macacae]OTA29019.1 ribonuclease PH [Alloscardovia macacae]